MKVKAFIIFASALFLFSGNAEARQHSHHHHYAHHHHYHQVASSDSSVVAHPSGCPARAFCGCGAAVRVFGHAVRDLFLASNWFKFPRTVPAPGMAAVRRHHVWILEAHVSGDTWIGYDANSGGHATRVHARRIAGYTIVNPHG